MSVFMVRSIDGADHLVEGDEFIVSGSSVLTILNDGELAAAFVAGQWAYVVPWDTVPVLPLSSPYAEINGIDGTFRRVEAGPFAQTTNLNQADGRATRRVEAGPFAQTTNL